MIESAVTIMLLYIATPGSSSGVTTTSAEYSSMQTCEAAGQKAKNDLSGWATTVRYSCSKK